MVQLAKGWMAEVERGPDWVYIRLLTEGDPFDSIGLADDLWNVLKQHLTYRLILELDGVERLPSQLIGQLLLLHKRIYAQGGLLRLCGVNQEGQDALAVSRLNAYLPLYASRSEAVLGRPSRPR